MVGKLFHNTSIIFPIYNFIFSINFNLENLFSFVLFSQGLITYQVSFINKTQTLSLLVKFLSKLSLIFELIGSHYLRCPKIGVELNEDCKQLKGESYVIQIDYHKTVWISQVIQQATVLIPFTKISFSVHCEKESTRVPWHFEASVLIQYFS